MRRIFSVCVAVVVFFTTYSLAMPALTASATSYCGCEEHVHDDSCYEKVLVCGMEEGQPEGQVSEDESTADDAAKTGDEKALHHHTDACYETRLVCQKEEHTHTLACYSNPDADVETAEQWEKTIPANLDEEETVADRLVAVAKSQVGYQESKENYEVAENGKTELGYTRYGAWTDEPYANWALDFTAFCLHYAGVKTVDVAEVSDVAEAISDAAGVSDAAEVSDVSEAVSGAADVIPVDNTNEEKWIKAVETAGLMKAVTEENDFVPGDLVFMSEETIDGVGTVPHMGIVTAVDKKNITVVEGDRDNAVVEKEYKKSSDEIVAVAALPGDVEDGTVADDATVTDADQSVADAADQNDESDDAAVEDDAVAEDGAAVEDGANTAEDGEDQIDDAHVDEETEDASVEDIDDNSVPEADAADAAQKTLTFKDEGYSVTASYASNVLPAGTELSVSEIKADGKFLEKRSYKKYMNRTEEALNTEISSARFFDITFEIEGEEVEPVGDVEVTVTLDEQNEGAVKAVHLPDGKDVEVMDAVAEGRDVSFTADSFSVYGVVYTVDFHWEVNGKMYEFSIPGGGFVSLEHLVEVLGIGGSTAYSANGSESAENGAENAVYNAGEESDVEGTTTYSATDLNALEISEETKQFVADVASVEFSSPELVWVGKVDSDSTIGALKEANKLECEYSAELTEEQIAEINAQKVEAGDWALISLQPFTSEETLTVTMKNGEVFTVKVTDAQSDAIHNSDGTVQTIPNPSGTTIELFNYYVSSDTKTIAGRDQWPGHIQDNNAFWKFNWYDLAGNYMCDWDEGFRRGYDKDNNYLLGYGNNLGINKNHVFKFTPANAGTVIDGTKGTKSVDGDNGGLNSWTSDADPRQGIVQGTLDGGYPKMTNDPSLGTDGTSLAYLFDDTAQEGKDCTGEVDHLLYVDPDGYYTYDSRDFKASLQTDNTFKVSDQPDVNDTELKGFWPYGDEVFWVGMHMNTQFSMPVDGTVLNPNGEYKDMQFEFSGDDDTWLYIDGVLVGDGGGIHNRTEIDVNFATGKVTVTGKKDTVHTGTFEETKWLDDIFKAAGRYNDADWEDIGDGSGHKRFKAGTYHTFDMFYLERGGGESNLYIHYNLVSTEDFTGHKAYEGFADGERMTRDQFQFEMIGLDGQFQSVWDSATQTATVTKLNDTGHAIMPVGGNESGAGTYADPKKVYNSSAYTDSEGNIIGGTIYTTGVMENGDIRFGSANIDQTEMNNCDQGHPSVYHYIVREVVPDDAVNADGITWANATDAQKKAGGFVKDQVQYDGRIYYMAARVTSWDQTGTDGTTYKAYGLSKTYYTDDTFTVEDTTEGFIDFRNTYAPDTGEVEFTKVNGSNESLAGATFTLYTDEACTKVAKDLDGTEQVVTTGEDGKVVFDNMAAPHTYYMKETAVPTEYETNNTVYKVFIEDSKDTASSSRIIVNGDESETEISKIVNTRPGEISVIKKWVDEDGNSVAGGSKTATVQLRRKKPVESQNLESHTVSVQMQVWCNNAWHVGTQISQTVYGDTIIIKWDDEWQGNFNWELTVGDNNYSGWISANNESGSGTNYNIQQIDDNGKSRQLTLTDVTGNVSFTVKHWVDWLYTDSNHWNNLNSPSITGSGSSTTYTFQDDTAFPSSTDTTATQTLKSSNSWAHIWSIGGTDSNHSGYDFPASDGTNPYYYYLVELKDDGSVVPVNGDVGNHTTLKSITYSPAITEEAPGLQEGLVTVTNEIASRTIKVKKNWETNPPSGSSITVELCKDGVATGKTITLDGTVDENGETAAWEGTFTVLEDGALYTVQESGAPSGYELVNITSDVSEGEDVWIKVDTLAEGDFAIANSGYALHYYNDGAKMERKELTNRIGDIITGLDESYQFKAVKEGEGYRIYAKEKKLLTSYAPWKYIDKTLKTTNGSNVRYIILSSGVDVYGSNSEEIEIFKKVKVKTEGNITYTLTNTQTSESTTANINIQKLDENNKGLANAIFRLQVKNSESIYQAVDKVTGFSDIIGLGTNNVGGKYDSEKNEIVGGENYTCTIKTTGESQVIGNLPDGEYMLEELEAPAGYVIELKQIEFKVQSGTVTMLTKNETLLDFDDGTATLKICNTPGAALPSTGGRGTAIFTILGTIVILGAGALLLVRRRRILG